MGIFPRNDYPKSNLIYILSQVLTIQKEIHVFNLCSQRPQVNRSIMVGVFFIADILPHTHRF